MGVSISSGGPKNPVPKLKEDGDTFKGVILSVKEMADRDYKTGKNKYWHEERKEVAYFDKTPDAEKKYLTPFMQFVMDVEDKDGMTWTVWASGKMRKAVIAAVKEAGESSIEPGAAIGIKVVSQEPRDFKALYAPPSSDE
jgi:hypothetical protein